MVDFGACTEFRGQKKICIADTLHCSAYQAGEVFLGNQGSMIALHRFAQAAQEDAPLERLLQFFFVSQLLSYLGQGASQALYYLGRGSLSSFQLRCSLEVVTQMTVRVAFLYVFRH
jgi:hypothetical protein